MMMVDAQTWLYSRPALCVLLKKPTPLPINFEDLAEGVFPVFPSKSTLSLEQYENIQDPDTAYSRVCADGVQSTRCDIQK